MEYWYNRNIQKVNEYKHLIMLDLKNNELEKLSKGDDFVEKFNEKITELNERETFQSAMTYEEDQRLILNTEKSISFDAGEKSKQIEIAKSMLKDNVLLETISKYTGLSIIEIENLK